MTPEQIELLQSSWRESSNAMPSIAELFYAKLFEIDPKLKNLFYGDMPSQYKKFSDTLSVIVEFLGDPETLAPKLHELGLRHVGYGVRDEYYEPVEQALIWALKQSLGEAFDASTEHAWIIAYRRVADAMISADIDSLIQPY